MNLTYILSGIIFDKKENSVKIGKNRVWKPSRIFKLIYNPSEDKVWVYLIKNESIKIVPEPISYEEFVTETGIKFGFINSNGSSYNSSSQPVKEQDIFIENIKSKFLEWLQNFLQSLIVKILH